MDPIPLVRKVALAPAIAYLAAEGVPVHRYLRRAGLSAPTPETLGTVIPLHQVIESVLSHPEMNLQLTAAIIGTSPRTLQRRLADHDTSFSSLLKSVRVRTAQRFLHDPEMPLTEIAERLSYTDVANFMRAFKRWTGIGPTEFRQLHYTDGHE